MYREIEEIYKKESPYNIIIKRTIFIYSIFIVISLVLNIYSKMIFAIIALFIMLICMKVIVEKTLNIKLRLFLRKKRNDYEPLPLIIKNKENKLFKDFCIKNNLYNEKALLCIIEHYRNLTKVKIVGGNLLAIISIILPIILSFYTKNGLDFKALTNALPYLISFTIIIVEIYYIYNQFVEIKKFLKGEDEIYERLEEIFSELYIENINISVANKKVNIKKKYKSIMTRNCNFVKNG